MDTIVLYNQNGQKFDVEVVRYFNKDNNKYLIFSLNEKDNNGYTQLYLTKVEEIDGQYVMSNVSDEKEWAKFRDTIQTIVNNNKAGIPNNDILDYTKLNGSTVSEFRIFKLKEEVAKALSEKDKVVEETKVVEKEMDLQSASAADNGLSIEEILKEVSEGAKNAREVTNIDLNKKNKLTIEDLLKTNKPVEEKEVVTNEVSNTDLEQTDDSEFVKVESAIPFTEAEEETAEEVIDENYEAKYKQAQETIKKLEEENIRLINELVEANAKLETIKDLL